MPRNLDTIVVTASRSEEKLKNVPARISMIEPQILEQSPIASLPDLLMSDASINMVQSGGYGQAASIFYVAVIQTKLCFKRWCSLKLKYFWYSIFAIY
jgi:outer membrane cobalamin receptor